MSKQAATPGTMTATGAQRGRRHRTAFGTAALVVVLATLGMTGAASAAPTGGNAPAAKACQKDGYQSLARAESPTVAFTSSGECTAYAAKGGTLTPLQTSQPTITYTQQYRYEDADGVVCGVDLILEDFAPLTTYDVFAGDQPDDQFKFKSATTDANGYAIVGLLGAHEGRTFYFTVAGITTEVLIDC